MKKYIIIRYRKTCPIHQYQPDFSTLLKKFENTFRASLNAWVSPNGNVQASGSAVIKFVIILDPKYLNSKFKRHAEEQHSRRRAPSACKREPDENITEVLRLIRYYSTQDVRHHIHTIQHDERSVPLQCTILCHTDIYKQKYFGQF